MLTGGRLELGLGAGHMKTEFDEAAIAWTAASRRIEHLETLVREVRRRLADEIAPAPVQRPIPVAIGAMSTRGLAVAADHADIVSFAGLRHIKGRPPGTFTVASAAQTDALVTYVYERRGERPYEADMLLQVVQVGVAPHQAADELAERIPGLDAERVLDSPFVLLARDTHEGAAELLRRAERWGISSITAFWPSLDTLRQIRDALPPTHRQ